jgi:uncharacterized membrane protein YeaQ/YmgE (transglycosylase-associated protein family)
VIGALILGLVTGAVVRLLMPRDVFRRMSGPAVWFLSVGIGLLGAVVGWFVFARLLDLGDDDVFDLEGIVGAIVGAAIVVPVAAFVLRRASGPRR